MANKRSPLGKRWCSMLPVGSSVAVVKAALQWEQAVASLGYFCSAGIVPDTIALNAVISACGRGEAWRNTSPRMGRRAMGAWGRRPRDGARRARAERQVLWLGIRRFHTCIWIETS